MKLCFLLRNRPGKRLLVPSQTRIVPPPPPPSEDGAPKKLTGSVLLSAIRGLRLPQYWLSPQNSGTRTVFFVDFAIKTVCFCGFTAEFMKTRVYFGMKTFFFFTSNFVKIRTLFEMKTFFLVFTPDFVEFCTEHLFFGPHCRIQRNKVFVSPQNLFKPPQSRYPGAGPVEKKKPTMMFERK